MIVSHEKKFVFFHIFKTAGTSVRVALAPYQSTKLKANQLLLQVGKAVAPLPMSRKFSHKIGQMQHLNYREATRWISQAELDEYFKFCFVRNPWDWIVSLYIYILRRKNHYLHQRVTKMANFSEFLEFYLGTEPRTQKSFLINSNGELAMDFIGRFENIGDDFSYACNRLGIDVDLPKENVSERKHYTEYYSDAERDALAAWFKEDIEAFGYSFRPAAADVPHLSQTTPEAAA